MTLNLSEKFVSPFVSDKELEAIKPEVEAADKALRSGTGAGAEMLGWELDTLLSKTLQAMAETEDTVLAEVAAL